MIARRLSKFLRDLEIKYRRWLSRGAVAERGSGWKFPVIVQFPRAAELAGPKLGPQRVVVFARAKTHFPLHLQIEFYPHTVMCVLSKAHGVGMCLA